MDQASPLQLNCDNSFAQEFAEKQLMAQDLEEEIAQLSANLKETKLKLQEQCGDLRICTVELETRTFPVSNIVEQLNECSIVLNTIMEGNEAMRDLMKKGKRQLLDFQIEFEAETLRRVKRFAEGPAMHDLTQIQEDIQSLKVNMADMIRDCETFDVEIREFQTQLAQEAMVILPGTGSPPEQACSEVICKMRDELFIAVEKSRVAVSREKQDAEMLDKEMQTFT